MSKQVTISETFKVNIDGYGNHQPEWYSEGGEVISIGKNKGEMTKPKWIKEDWYFDCMSKALLWGVKNGKVSGDAKAGDMTATEYLDELKRVEKEIKEVVDA